jgi:hypothetical protein
MDNIPLRNKPIFIGLSCLSLFCLVSSFANPLQRLEVYQQIEIGAFNLQYQKRFVITENDRDYPYGFNPSKAEKVAQIHQDYKIEKVFFLFVAIVTASASLYLGNEVVGNDEINSEIRKIKSEGRKQLILEGIKHQLALASKSQRLLFLDEMKAMMDEFGSDELERLEMDELLIIGEERTPEDTPKFRELFPENLDATTWKAVTRAISEGLSDEEIVADILGCGKTDAVIGEKYLSYLKGKLGY